MHGRPEEHVLEPVQKVGVVEVQQVQLGSEIFAQVDAIPLIELDHLINQPLPLSVISFVDPLFDALLLENLRHDERVLGVHEVVLVHLIAADH